LKVLLVGVDRVSELGASFRTALLGLGHQVRLFDPTHAYTLFDHWPLRRLTRPLFGGVPSGYKVWSLVVERVARSFKPALVLSVGGWLTAELLQDLRRVTKARFVMYSTDNPFNAVASGEYVRYSLPLWDAIATPRRATISQLKEYCPGNVFYLPFGYDSDLHYPEGPGNAAEWARFGSDTVFIGACDADRVPYLDPLAQSIGLRVDLYGGGAYRRTAALKKRHQGMAFGRDYRLALGGTKVALCLVRRANSDSHVMRTFEAPACGAFMLAERTPDHEEMFDENKESAFFTSPEEMVDKIRYYVAHPDLRRKIAEAGYKRITASGNTYGDRIEMLLRSALDQRLPS
jgi:spore maturation protein CgeB